MASNKWALRTRNRLDICKHVYKKENNLPPEIIVFKKWAGLKNLSNSYAKFNEMETA